MTRGYNIYQYILLHTWAVPNTSFTVPLKFLGLWAWPHGAGNIKHLVQAQVSVVFRLGGGGIKKKKVNKKIAVPYSWYNWVSSFFKLILIQLINKVPVPKTCNQSQVLQDYYHHRMTISSVTSAPACICSTRHSNTQGRAGLACNNQSGQHPNMANQQIELEGKVILTWNKVLSYRIQVYCGLKYVRTLVPISCISLSWCEAMDHCSNMAQVGCKLIAQSLDWEAWADSTMALMSLNEKEIRSS